MLGRIDVGHIVLIISQIFLKSGKRGLEEGGGGGNKK